VTGHTDYLRILLEEIEAGNGRSQRSLAKQLGIALGLTNLLLKQVIRRGWIRMVQVKPNRVAYLITPAGMAEKAQMSRDYLVHSARYYASARDRLLEVFNAVSREWPAPGQTCRVAFYGAGEIAEIGYVCLQSTNLTLVGVVDEARQAPFFGLPIHRPSDLGRADLGGIPFDRLIVMSLHDVAPVSGTIDAVGVPEKSVFWLRDWRWVNPLAVAQNVDRAVALDAPRMAKRIDSNASVRGRNVRSAR